MLMCPISPALAPQIQAESQNVVGNKSGSRERCREREEEASLSPSSSISVLSRNLDPGDSNTERDPKPNLTLTIKFPNSIARPECQLLIAIWDI